MKWWVFNEQQLDMAIAEFALAEWPDEPHLRADLVERCALIRRFLDSQAARRHKLRGDAER